MYKYKYYIYIYIIVILNTYFVKNDDHKRTQKILGNIGRNQALLFESMKFKFQLNLNFCDRQVLISLSNICFIQ